MSRGVFQVWLWIQAAPLAVFVLVQALLLAYAAHRYVTLWRWARSRRSRSRAIPVPETWPSVTVQLPLYNERLVAQRLIDAAAELDYPRHLLRIQVLDDSTDVTTERVMAAVARHRERGIDIEVIHRERRQGYKAGALAHGLERTRSALIVVFDADFVPARDFLKRIVPHFSDPSVGMVQARWGHLNRNRSILTRAQAVMLDAHFLLEHEARMGSGLFFNFNGTAGAWRRSCIEAAGGWEHDTLTEDLDLSYRAQLQGWRFVSVPGIEVAAELPAEARDLESQQRRWTRGSIQTARKLLPSVMRSGFPRRVKLEAFVHLTSNLTYPLLLLSGLLLLPVIATTSIIDPGLAVAIDAGVILLGIVPVCGFLVWGQLAAGARGWRIAGDVLAVLVVGAGLSLNNSRAVLQGLGRHMGDWERTPKTGDGGSSFGLGRYTHALGPSGRAEAILAAYFAWLAGLAWSEGHARSIPHLVLLAAGLGYIGVRSLVEGFLGPGIATERRVDEREGQ